MDQQSNREHAGERANVDLEIRGKGLLLSGVFGAWQSRLVLGPDLDDVGVNLFVDSTSVRNAGDVDVSEKLFSFRSRDVVSLGKGKYRVTGDFTGAEATRPLEVSVETPLGHTPHIVVSFNAEKKDFGSHWTSLVENATLFGSAAEEEEGPRREAAGWLTVPTVAAA
ncbi:MAG TPA: YceI family protein [Polyangia bacterium]|jgi:polyisoprenoid-binding protein YceI|nr:YceI family protein [Polyangia bacterium]